MQRSTRAREFRLLCRKGVLYLVVPSEREVLVECVGVGGARAQAGQRAPHAHHRLRQPRLLLC
jgi:hypothetical protein